MKISNIISFFLCSLLSLTVYAADDKGEKITFEDHILPILENKCLNCHNPDEAKGGLDLSTYGAMLTGGSGGKVVEPENPGSSRLFTLMAHAEEPYMPPRKPKSPDKELELVTKWINGGILETSSSKARKSDKPKMDMSLITATGKPEGPAAMPEHVILQPEIVTERPNAIPALAHSPWAPIVAVAGQKQVILYHSEDFDVLGILPYPEGFPQSLSFSSSGALLQAGGGRGGKSGGVVAWDVKTGERVFEVGREFDIVLGSDISPDHSRVVMGGPGRIFKIWDTVSGEQITAVKKHPDWMLTADYSPDGILLATGGRNSGLYVWEGASGLEFYTLKGHTEAVTDLAWRPDSNILASISEDGAAMLWEMNEGKQIKKWTAHPGGGLAIDFSPDGQMIASGGRDKKVKIWKADGAGLRTIDASDDIVMSVVFSHDNKRVISGDYNGVVKVWNVADGKELGTLDANPPTIDTQLEYAEKRLTELTSKIPTLEKEVTEARTKADAARKKLAEVSKKAGEISAKKAAMDKEFAALDSKLKALNDRKQKAEGSRGQNTKLMQQRTAERVKAEQAYAAARKSTEAEQKKLESLAENLKKVHTDLEAADKAANQPVFDDPAKEKAYQTARAAMNQATLAKTQADANVAAKRKTIAELKAQLAPLENNLAEVEKRYGQIKSGYESAQAKLKAASAAKILADDKVAEASRDGQEPAQELVAAQQKAAKDIEMTQQAFDAVKPTHDKAMEELAAAQAKVDRVKETMKGPTSQLATAEADLKSKADAIEKAKVTLAQFASEGSPRMKAVFTAQEALPAKMAVHKKAVADFTTQEKRAKDAAALMAKADAALKSALAAEKSARGQMEEATSMVATTAKELQTTGTELNSKKAELAKINAELDSLTKQKEAQAKAISDIAAQEAKAKEGIELAKADLAQREFLYKKFKAAAINYEAKLESDELSDMAVDLDDMKKDETEAKEEHKMASNARVEAENTLAKAKKTVDDGTRKLKETTASVLDRALALIASRASVEIAEEASSTIPTDEPTEVASAETESSRVNEFTNAFSAVISPDVPAEVKQEEEVVEVVSSKIKTREEISAEIAAIQKRLSELSESISKSYTEADKMKETVDKAADVAQKTPSEIAKRAEIEKKKAEAAQAIESERKKQEALVDKQKALIDELKQKYLESVPERK